MQQKKPHVSLHTLIFVEHWNNSIFSIIIIIIIIYLFIYIKYLQLYSPSQLSQKHLFFAQYVKFQLGTTTEHWNKTQLLLVLAPFHPSAAPFVQKLRKNTQLPLYPCHQL
jgi:hypothetical protein